MFGWDALTNKILICSFLSQNGKMLKNLAKLYMYSGIGLYFKHSTKLMAPLQMWDLTFNPHDVIIFICFNLSLIFVVTGQKVRNKQHEILNLIKNFNSS